MGIILRQASKSSLSSYLGAAIGFFNVAILMTQIFSTDELGLRSVLLDIAVVFSLIAQLGTGRSMVKFHPFFYQSKKSDNGLFSFSLLISFLGYLLLALAVYALQEQLIDYFDKKSSLFSSYFWAIFPLSFLMLLNIMFESNLQAKVRTAISAFLKDVVNRILITLFLILYYYKIIDFHQFIILFILSYAFTLCIYIIYLLYNKQLNFRINKFFFTKRVKRIYFRYSLFSIWTNSTGILVTKLDTIMILFILGLSKVGIYSNALYLTMLINIPASSIVKISFPIISKHWKRKRIDLIEELYKKSSINQFLSGGVLFILLWSNLDNLFSIQGEVFREGRYVIFILGIARLFNMISGVNSQIISASKYYPFESITSTFLVLIAIISNLIFIPIYGLIGAAFATGVSLVLFNLSRLIFIYKKMKIQPFNSKTIISISILVLGFATGSILPQLDNIYFDTIYRTIIILIVLIVPTLYFKVSPDINSFLNSRMNKIGVKL